MSSVFRFSSRSTVRRSKRVSLSRLPSRTRPIADPISTAAFVILRVTVFSPIAWLMADPVQTVALEICRIARFSPIRRLSPIGIAIGNRFSRRFSPSSRAGRLNTAGSHLSSNGR